jgi:adenine-specific DNA-methyltransferase
VFTAIAYPSIIVAEKHVPAEDHQLLALNWNPNTPLSQFTQAIERARAQLAQPGPNAPLVLQKRLTPDGWRLEGETTQRLLDKLRRAGRPLGDYVGGRFYRGILTGLNEAFVVDRVTRDRLIAEHPSSAELLKPYLRGRDVKRWRVENPDLWLIFTRRGTNIDSYPAIKQHLSAFKDALMPGTGRKPGSYQWYEIQDNVAYWQEFEQPKIIIPAIVANTSYAIDQDNFFSNDKTSICIHPHIHYLGAVLNSQVLWWYIRQIAATRQNGYYEFKPMYVTQLPIPISSSTTAIDGLVERILATKQQDAKADVSAWEDEINQRVYALYGLRSDEIRQIEEAVGAAGASDEQRGDEQ